MKRRYGKIAESMEPYHHHLDLRFFDDLDDAAFAYLMVKVKGVNMLDLNETEISNESIQLLTRLEYLTELRAKGCSELNNQCIPLLNKIPSLELLHVKCTDITIDGLMQLNALPNLKLLLFSDDDAAALPGKILQLKKILPGCELVVDGKPY